MRMFTLALAAVALPAAFAAAAPAHAQANTRTLTVFGNDPCPTSSGEEIVVCRRLPEQERFRVPIDLRQPTPTAENTAGAVRNSRIVDQALAADNSGQIGSCSTVGAAGASGCFLQEARRNREARQAEGERPAIRF